MSTKLPTRGVDVLRIAGVIAFSMFSLVKRERVRNNKLKRRALHVKQRKEYVQQKKIDKLPRRKL